MENYIKAQQEILRVASQLIPGEVHIFGNQRLFDSGICNRLVDSLNHLNMHIGIIYDNTTNPILVGRVIGRPDIEIDNDSADGFPVVVGSIIARLAFVHILLKARFAEKRNFSLGDTRTIWIPNKQEDTTNLPIIGSCQYADKPEQCPNLTQAGDSMGMLMAPIKNKDDLSAEFRKVTSDVMYANHFENYKIDADGIYQEISTAPLDDYKIEIRYSGRTISVNKVVGSKIISNPKLKLSYLEIYLSSAQEAEPLDLQPIEKAIYLTMLLYSEKGVYIEKLETYSPKLDKDYKAFFDILIKIYENLPNSRRYDNSDNSDNSDIIHIRDLECIKRSTFLRYKKNIKDKIAAQIKNTRLAQQFSIEGPRNGLNRIEKSTPELREEIRKIFSLL